MSKFRMLLLCLLMLQVGCQSPCCGRWFSGGYGSSCPTCTRGWGRFRLPCGCGMSGKTPDWLSRWFSRKPCEPSPYVSLGYEPFKDDLSVKQAAGRCSTQALHELCSYGGHPLSSDFKDGFRQAFVDVAMGGNGVTPAIPPEKYWKSYYRTADGHARADEWFEGYRAGAVQAHSHGVSDYNFVPASYSPDFPPTAAYPLSAGREHFPQQVITDSPTVDFADAQARR